MATPPSWNEGQGQIKGRVGRGGGEGGVQLRSSLLVVCIDSLHDSYLGPIRPRTTREPISPGGWWKPLSNPNSGRSIDWLTRWGCLKGFSNSFVSCVPGLSCV